MAGKPCQHQVLRPAKANVGSSLASFRFPGVFTRMLRGFPEVKREHEILLNILIVGGWGCRASSDYKAEEELSWYTWLTRSCTCARATCAPEWGGPPRSSLRPGLAPSPPLLGPVTRQRE